MKRGTIEHPKMVELRDVLNLPLYQAVGLLEALWHFTATYAAHGNIGRFSDRSIAKALEWEQSPETLIDALVETGWLDRSETHRLVVHDWAEHADNAVHLKLKRRNEKFVDGTEPYSRKGGVETVSGQCRDNVASRTPLPDARCLMPDARVKETPRSPGGEPGGFDDFWQAYPRKVGKGAALKAWKRIRPNADLTARMLAVIRRESTSEQWVRDGGQYIPHPATWLNQGRWDDELPEPVKHSGAPPPARHVWACPQCHEVHETSYPPNAVCPTGVAHA